MRGALYYYYLASTPTIRTYLLIGGVSKQITAAYVLVGGVVKPVTTIHTLVGGAVKSI